MRKNKAKSQPKEAPRFVQIAVGDGDEHTSHVLYALDEDGRVWSRVDQAGYLWSRMSAEVLE
jgi:hypothetical protein